MCAFFVLVVFFFFSSRRRHTRCALVTGVQTCALPIWSSIGISVLQAMTIRNAATVHSRLVETVRPDNPNVAKAMPGLDFSSLESLLKVNGEITRQASMVSYIDAFYALFVVIILISPLILLMRPPDRQSTRLNSSH